VDYVVLQDENPQMIYSRIAPGGGFTDMRAHRGEDFWYVIEGKADLSYGGRSITLSAGESARFSSTVPHGILNPHDEVASLVALCSVPYW
jgi:mannose-6-phosphate isomerase-like protein (cupin superfamily)